MGLSSADVREIRSIILSVFNEKFISEISDKVADMVNRRFEEELSAQKKLINGLNQDLANLQKENSMLRMAVDNQEQAMRSCNVRIFGMKSENNENVRAKVLDIFTNKLKLQISSNDLKKCHRISAKVPSDKPPAVLVRFSNDEVWSSVLKSRKSLKNTGIHIREDLTKSRLSLLQCAVNQFTSKSAWVFKGNVFVKCVNGIVKRVTSEPEIIDLKNSQHD